MHIPMYITVAMIASAVIEGWEGQCEVVGQGSGLLVRVHSHCRMSVASVLSLLLVCVPELCMAGSSTTDVMMPVALPAAVACCLCLC